MYRVEYDDAMLLSDLPDNEIGDVTDIAHKPIKYFKEPEVIKRERERTREMREGEFRKWLIKNKSYGAVMTPIETSTATGVPDIYTCYQGHSQWIECKIAMIGPARIRGTQYLSPETMGGRRAR